MAASYPASAKSFTAINTGDIVQDTHPEVAYDEITAMETALLTGGLAHNLFPDSTGNARTLGTSSKRWGQAYVKGLTLGASTELTIATGAVTATPGYFSVDTESDAATDDLDTITAGTGVVEGTIVVLRAENVARVVTVKDGTGNLLLEGDYALSATDRMLTLIYDGTNWRQLAGGARSAARAIVYHSTTQSLSNGSEAAVLFNSEDVDTDGMHDTGSNTSRLTNTTGATAVFLVTATVSFASNATGSRTARLVKNGATSVSGYARCPGVSGDPSDVCLSAIVSLAASDYVEVMAAQNSGGSLNIGHASSRSFQNNAQIVRVA